MLAPRVQNLNAPLSTISQVIEETLLVQDKVTSKIVDFKLNNEQRQVDLNLTGRDIVIKGRQFGMSTWKVARQVIKCLVHHNFNAVMVSHNAKATEKLLKKAFFFIDNYKGPSTKLKTRNTNTITFLRTNSTLSIGTAGSADFGVGDTIHDLHCSEIPRWPNPEELTRGLFQAVPDNGELTLEATGRQAGSFFHKLVQANLPVGSLYTIHFVDWFGRPEYSLNLTAEEAADILSHPDMDIEELEFRQKAPHATAGQIAWRRRKLKNELLGDIASFKEEYPVDLSEAFQARGYGIFPKVNYIETPRWKLIEASAILDTLTQDHTLHILEGHPTPNRTYVAGVDVGGGVGKDRSIIFIGCVETKEQVAEYASDKIRPDEFGKRIKDLCTYFGNCLVVPESNNYGHTAIAALKMDYDEALIYQKDRDADGDSEYDEIKPFGFNTTRQSKVYAIGLLRTLLFENFKIHSLDFQGEASTFIETDSGRLEASAGNFDDRIMAGAMFVIGLQELYRYVTLNSTPKIDQNTTLNPFSLEAMQAEIEGSENNLINGNLWL